MKFNQSINQPNKQVSEEKLFNQSGVSVEMTCVVLCRKFSIVEGHDWSAGYAIIDLSWRLFYR